MGALTFGILFWIFICPAFEGVFSKEEAPTAADVARNGRKGKRS